MTEEEAANEHRGVAVVLDGYDEWWLMLPDRRAYTSKREMLEAGRAKMRGCWLYPAVGRAEEAENNGRLFERKGRDAVFVYSIIREGIPLHLRSNGMYHMGADAVAEVDQAYQAFRTLEEAPSPQQVEEEAPRPAVPLEMPRSSLVVVRVDGGRPQPAYWDGAALRFFSSHRHHHETGEEEACWALQEGGGTALPDDRVEVLRVAGPCVPERHEVGVGSLCASGRDLQQAWVRPSRQLTVSTTPVAEWESKCRETEAKEAPFLSPQWVSQRVAEACAIEAQFSSIR